MKSQDQILLEEAYKKINESKRIMWILVKDKEGKTVESYAPNHIGTKTQDLLDKAEKQAKEIGGKVKVTYYK